MKKSLLLVVLQLFIFANVGSAQINSDDPSFNHPVQPKGVISAPTYAKSITNGSVTIDGEILACDSTETTLSVTGACFYEWYSDSAQTNLVGANSDLVVNSITSDTTVYYVGAQVESAVSFALPTQSSPYSGNARGYYFQAPSDMNISKIYVPIDASTGAPSVTIVRFDSVPPTYSAVTNNFTVLGLWQNATTDTIFACIPVFAGDYIGVLGQRAGVNSYATGPFNTTINGSTVALTRLGMQFPLATTAPQDLWTEPTSSISRIELFYGDLVQDQVIPVDIVVPQPYSASSTVNFCPGDSVMVNGGYYSSNATLVDSLQTISGCDSLLITNVIELPTYSLSDSLEFCSGDSVLINSVYYTSAGTVTSNYQTVAGCDSIVITELSTFALPDVTVTQSQDGVLLTSNQAGASYQWVDCATGSPVTGETGMTFTATANGDYAVEVTLNGCSYLSNCTTVSTVGVYELEIDFDLSVFPNPTSSVLNYTFNGVESLEYKLLDLNGKLVLDGKMKNNAGKIDVSNIASGTYVLEVLNNEQIEIIRIVID